MDVLSSIPTPVVLTLFAAVFGILGWLGRGIGFLAGRWVKKSPTTERADYLHTVADFGIKLRLTDMSFEEVQDLEAVMRDYAVSSSAAAKRVVEEVAADASLPQEFHPNVVMKARAGATYEVAQAKLQQVLLDIQLLLNEKENTAFDVAQHR